MSIQKCIKSFTKKNSILKSFVELQVFIFKISQLGNSCWEKNGKIVKIQEKM
jgi:hypothetical protein